MGHVALTLQMERNSIGYYMFWKVLKDLGVWRDEEYLRRKQDQTVWDDRRDILPHCVIAVSSLYQVCIISYITGSETSLSQS